MKLKQWMMKSSIGPLFLVASEQGLRGIYWKKQDVPMVASPDDSLAQAVEQIGEYLEGQRQSFDLTLDIQGTDFQKKVWRELAKIPYGKTRSYADIAKKLKNDKAVRAVGTANGRNPLSLVVPCHRVINSSGALGGYAGGLEIKQKLLELERRA